MSDWTDGTDLPLSPNIGGMGETVDLDERYILLLPVVQRRDILERCFLEWPHYMTKLTRPGEEFAFAKIYAGDLGHYLVVPTYVLNVPVSESIN